MSHYYDMDGQPITMEKWCETFEDFEHRRIGYTELPGGCRVSTVWLGLDHSFREEGPPLIFESMVFGPDDSTDLDMIRYSTREEAEQGHSLLVTRWTGWTPGDEHPEDTSRSFLSQFIDALDAATGERQYNYADSWNDAMVVMYPKEIAKQMEEDNPTEGNQR